MIGGRKWFRPKLFKVDSVVNSLGSGGCEGSRGSEVCGGEFLQEVLGLLEFLKVLGGVGR